MGSDKSFKIIEGPNLRVLDVKGFDRIAFGCPPRIVKYFDQRNEEVPAKYVLPSRTFMKGRNNFDFEFIVYSFLFVRTKKEKITVYCTKDQKNRFKIILGETLFGPSFRHILQAQFRQFEVKRNFSSKERQKFQVFLKNLSADKKIIALVNSHLKTFSSEKTIHNILKGYFEDRLKNSKWLAGKNIKNSASNLAKNFFFCAQLKNEIELFSLARDDEQAVFLDQLVDFKIFDKNKAVHVERPKDRRQKLKIVQSQPSLFEVYKKNKLTCVIDMTALDLPAKPDGINSIQKPFVGATFLGVGSGFTHKRRNSSTLVWMEGKGILIDAFSDHSEILLGYGITESDISCMVLTHVHSDHDSGFIEKILSGQRLKIISTRIIFESFLRKIEAITCFPKEVLESFIEFIDLAPHKKTRLPGFERTWITLDYSLHSIPSVRLVISYVDEKGKETSISHSGDTKYDRQLIDNWYHKGVYSRTRRDHILGFIWDSDMIIHEVGGGSLHTEFSALTDLDDSLTKKMILVHQNKDPLKHPKFRFAHDGQTETLIKAKKVQKRLGVDDIKDIILFKDLTPRQLKKMFDQSEIKKVKADKVIFYQNDLGDSFYALLDGFAEIIIDGKSLAIYEKGMFFGELAVSTKNPRRRATVKTMTPSTLLKIPNRFYREFNLPEIQDEFYMLGNFFNNVIDPRLDEAISSDLVASLGFGKIVHWNKHETIFPIRGGGKEIYIILSGQVEILNNKEKQIALLSEGEILGKPSNMKNTPRSAQIRVHSDKVFAVRLDSKHIKRMFQLFPSFYGTVYQKLRKMEA